MAYEASAADREMARLARHEGAASVTARKIWRWRRAGLIPSPVRHGLGRGRGTRSEYPPESARQAAAVQQVLSEHRRLVDVRLILFVRGFPIELAVLRAAYVARLNGLAAYITSIGGDVTDRNAFAEKAGIAIRRDAKLRPLKRGFRTNLRRHEMRSREALTAALVDWVLISFLQHETAIQNPTPEFLVAAGSIGEGDHQVPRDQLFRMTGLRSVANLVRSATIEQFELARKGAVALFDGFEEIARAIIESGAIKPAYGADADWKARRDLERMRSAKGDLFVAAFVLPMLVILDAAGEQGFRDAVRSWGLLLRLSSDFFLGGEQQMEETAGRIDDVIAEIEASIE